MNNLEQAYWKGFVKEALKQPTRYPENITGKHYVDTQCVDCDLCRETAPSLFKRSASKGYAYVSKQPTTPQEKAQMTEAMQACPVKAIH